ncbi:MAG: hypothetical protein A2Y66_05140 [Nitrospirae bacterium RBG_13_41_22]|nr:MAG: hypothetical protein A2Y66_05140 [Nitrospirae bacterium RBG_13_41_22]
MGKKRRLLDEYRFPGFRPRSETQGIFGDPRARVIRLDRTQKKLHAAVAGIYTGVTTTRQYEGYGIYPVGTPGSTWKWRFAGSSAKGVGK